MTSERMSAVSEKAGELVALLLCSDTSVTFEIKVVGICRSSSRVRVT